MLLSKYKSKFFHLKRSAKELLVLCFQNTAAVKSLHKLVAIKNYL